MSDKTHYAQSPWLRAAIAFALGLMLSFLTIRTAFAHDAPDGTEWVMADWMFLSFVLFAGAAFVAFLFALKAGLLSNMEDAKYHILTIVEDDYYTPAWAQTGEHTGEQAGKQTSEQAGEQTAPSNNNGGN